MVMANGNYVSLYLLVLLPIMVSESTGKFPYISAQTLDQ
jgi:hypothetical protein